MTIRNQLGPNGQVVGRTPTPTELAVSHFEDIEFALLTKKLTENLDEPKIVSGNPSELEHVNFYDTESWNLVITSA